MARRGEDQQQLPGRRENRHRDQRDAAEHRAAIYRETGVLCLFDPCQKFRKRRLIVPVNLRQRRRQLFLAGGTKSGDDDP